MADVESGGKLKPDLSTVLQGKRVKVVAWLCDGPHVLL
jgi:hypothetical protein